MAKKKGAAPPKAPAKGASVKPKKSRELDEKELKGVAGGARRSTPGCTCSNMPLDPG